MKLYDDKDRERQKDISKLREEITRLTVRLHEEGSHKNLLHSRLVARNEYLARYHQLLSFRRGGVERVLIVWRKYVGRQKERKKIKVLFLRRCRMKVRDVTSIMAL